MQMNALCAVLFSLALQFSTSPFGAEIRGQILDPEGAVVAHATIRVLDEASRKTVQSTQSSADGTFTVRRFAHGNYLLAISAPGFAEKLIRAEQVHEIPSTFHTIHLDILDCDAPHVNCDIFTSGPYTDPHPVILNRDMTVAAGNAVNLEKGSLVLRNSPVADLRLEADSGGLYLAPLNGAAFTTPGSEGSCGKSRDKQPLRIDGMGPESEIVMRTARGQCSRIFITREIPAGADRATFQIVTRRD
jgi:hypothetical protein